VFAVLGEHRRKHAGNNVAISPDSTVQAAYVRWEPMTCELWPWRRLPLVALAARLLRAADQPSRIYQTRAPEALDYRPVQEGPDLTAGVMYRRTNSKTSLWGSTVVEVMATTKSNFGQT